MRIPLICLDGGHGAKDWGATGPGGLKEKDVALSVTMLTKALLLQGGDVRVMTTRDSDAFVELDERAAIANRAGADVFLSIHCNSAKKPVMGIETVIAKRTAVSFPLGESIQDALMAEFPKHTDRGLKRANFRVLTQTKMAAALAELEFLHVACGEAHLADPRIQKRYAQALCVGLRDFLGLPSAPLMRPRSIVADPPEPIPCPALAMADQVRAVSQRLLEIAAMAERSPEA